uniref:Protein kinase domain-containing protein n=1 Tax=Poecilia mexicana TaxID=48701 RepID=A0A3B3XPE7_9TELE
MDGGAANMHYAQSLLLCIRLEQLSCKTDDLAQKMLRLVPTERISAQEALQHPYFSTLPAPIMHLRDGKTTTC